MSLQSSGGTLDPNVQDQVSGLADAQIQWNDLIYVAGTLPVGTPVLLQVNSLLDGSVVSSGGGDSPSTFLFYGLQLGQSSGQGTSAGECGQPALSGLSAIDQQNTYVGPTTTINSKQTYYICTTEGSTLYMLEQLSGSVYGSALWSDTVDAANTASTQIIALTPGAEISSASGVSYSGAGTAAVPEPSMLLPALASLLTLLAAGLWRRVATGN
jgi:hypothetical protein